MLICPAQLRSARFAVVFEGKGLVAPRLGQDTQEHMWAAIVLVCNYLRAAAEERRGSSLFLTCD